MIASIHQPHFFPWAGYFHKIVNSDVFVFLDNVQFRKNYFQNRTQIKDYTGSARWLAIPVQKAPLNTPINRISISPVFQPEKIIDTLTRCYGKAPYFKELSKHIFDVINEPEVSLSKKNISCINQILSLLELKTPTIVASELSLLNDDPNARLIEICRKIGADTYLAGQGGRKYMDLNLFLEKGLRVQWQLFNPELLVYSQINGEFLKGLSVLDLLFNIGQKATKEIIIEHNVVLK